MVREVSKRHPWRRLACRVTLAAFYTGMPILEQVGGKTDRRPEESKWGDTKDENGTRQNIGRKNNWC